MSDLKEQIANTKSIDELHSVFNDASKEILENISNIKYSDVVKHIDNLMMNLVEVKREGKITWDNTGSKYGIDPKHANYDNIDSSMKEKIAINMYHNAEQYISGKNEFNNFRTAIIRTITEFDKVSKFEEIHNLMSEDINFYKKEFIKPNLIGNNISNNNEIKFSTQKIETSIDSNSSLQEEISNTNSIDDLIKVLSKENTNLLKNIHNLKTSDVEEHIHNLLMNIVHAKQERTIKWDNHIQTFSDEDIKKSTYCNLGSKLKNDIAHGLYLEAEKYLVEFNRFVELNNFRYVLINTVSEINKTLKNKIDIPMSEERYMHSNINSSLQNRVQDTLDKVRNSDNDKKSSHKNN